MKDDWGDKGPMAEDTTQEKYSSPCPLKIAEVNPLGSFIRLVNSSLHENVDISGYILWQLEGGHPVSMYRFPQGLTIPACQQVTVWASAAKVSHNPPTDLLWKGRVYFRSNMDCITVLSRPNGQPVASYKTVEPRSLHTTVRTSVSQNQKSRRWPVVDQQHQNNSSSPSTPAALLPRRHSISATACQSGRAPWRMSQSHPVNTAQHISPIFNHTGLASSGPSPPCVTWHPQRLNTSSPLVKLVAQKSARSRHGFNFLSYIPFTFDLLRV
ncbi:lamin tail domain-containing protein 1-like [Hyperolius riggenbachi]|uniref:lamin tail domain-containing protein 1-like n=1 Tax=Hyperolius riggenbachi TaxID=752182 RepID=UPI0035A387DD